MKPAQLFIISAIILTTVVYWLWLSPEQGPGISLIADQPLPKEQPAPAQDKVLLEQALADDIQAPTPQTGDNVTQEAAAPVLKTAVKFAQLPSELREMIGTYFIAYRQGNYDFAALVALDAIELSDDYPKIKILMHAGAGQCYEKLHFIEMAIEQYQQALVIDPKHRPSYMALRRLDPEFAASHPELPKPERKKTVTRPPTATTTTGQ
jgi:tetratricopeptide (TPR) repeat protein